MTENDRNTKILNLYYEYCALILKHHLSCCPVLDCPVLDCPILDCPVLDCPVLDCTTCVFVFVLSWAVTI